MDGATPDTTTATEAKAKRGDGLLKVFFADAEKADHKRIPAAVTAVLVNGQRFELSSIPTAVKDQLVAFAFKARAGTYVNNHVDEAKNGADVPELVNKVYSDLVAGKLYSETSEGAKKGKTFDPTDWVEAIRMAREMANKQDSSKPLATQAQLDQMRTKLVEMAPKDRVSFIQTKLRSQPLILAQYNIIQAKKNVAAYNANKENTDKASAFDALLS